MISIRASWKLAWRRRDLRPIWQWARDNTDLRPPLTITGPFDVSRSRHFIGPLEALQDDHVREMNVLKPVRGGGTLLADIWVPWARVNDPGPTMFVLQTDPLADDHFTKVLLPTMESVPEIRKMLDSLDRFKKTGRKIEWADGNHLHVNGPSVGNLQTNAFRYVIEDECWLYESGRMADAEGRVGDFAKLETSKILRVSQGGPRERLPIEECAWYRAYHHAEINEWEVACLHCAGRYQPVFGGRREDGSYWGIVWDHHKRANGDWDEAKCLPTVRFECPHCRKPTLDTARTKSEWNRTGAYIRTSEENHKRKSFHWEAVIDYPWDELVTLWFQADNAAQQGDFAPKIQFYQKRRALFMNEERLRKSGMTFRQSTYEINADWPEEKARFFTLDRQEEDMFWGEVRAWAEGRTRQLWYGKLYGFAAVEEKRVAFKVEPNHTLMDSAYNPKGDNGVYAACIKYGWIAIRGDAADSFMHRGKNGKIILRSYAPVSGGDPGIPGTRRLANVIRFSKNQMNQIVQRMIDKALWEEQAAPEDPEMQKEYRLQMSSRFRKVLFEQKSGKSKIIWYESKNDHARDTGNGQVLAAMLRDLLPDPATERKTVSEEKAELVTSI